MSNIARKIAKTKAKKQGIVNTTTFARKAGNGAVTMRLNPVTDEMQEFHFTKGWR